MIVWLDTVEEMGNHPCYSSGAVSAHDILLRREPSQELGANHFVEQRRHDLVDRLLQRLAYLG